MSQQYLLIVHRAEDIAKLEKIITAPIDVVIGDGNWFVRVDDIVAYGPPVPD